MSDGKTKHVPEKPVSSREELEDLLVAGLESGDARPLDESDWDRLRARALEGTEVRRSG